MSDTAELHLENYEGPLDLLLDLVKDKKMDIFSVDLNQLATQYLALIDKLKDTNLDLASEYLVMAATLLQLKTKMLLEDPNKEAEVEAEKQDLLKQLEYQQYKLVAEKLRENESLRKNIFIKDASDYAVYAPEVDESKLDGNSDAIKLIQQMRKMFERLHATKLRQTTIEAFNLSPAERRVELIQLLKETEGHPTFEQIFNVPTINHFVVTMLTVLDMARKQELKLYQDEQFGEIRIEKGVINE